MKHLSKFNENAHMSITWVDFSGGGDGVYAIYIDNKLHKYGDDYHNQIQDWYIGFKDGLEYGNVSFTENKIKLPSDNEWIERVSELADSPPDNISGLTQ